MCARFGHGPFLTFANSHKTNLAQVTAMARLAIAAILLLLVVCCAVHAATTPKVKIGARLGHYLTNGDQNGVLPKREPLRRSDGSSETLTAIWVLFTDKCGSGNGAQELNSKAIARRAKHGFVLLSFAFSPLIFECSNSLMVCFVQSTQLDCI